MRKTTAVGAALDEQLVEVRQHKHRKFQQDRAGAVSLQHAAMPTSGATAEMSGAAGSGASVRPSGPNADSAAEHKAIARGRRPEDHRDTHN